MLSVRTVALPAISRYSPILIANAAVLLLTYLYIAVIPHMGAAVSTYAMSAFMGFFFIVYAMPKLANITAFARASTKYDVLSKKFPAYGYAYPFIELSLGTVYLIHSIAMAPLIAASILNGLVILLTLLNIISVSNALIYKKEVTCNCLGGTTKVPLTKYALFENGLMLLMALYMVLTPYSAMAM